MKVFIVGTGVGDLTQQAKMAIDSAQIIIGARRMAEQFTSAGKQVFIAYEPTEIAGILRNSDAEAAAVLMSGDCGFFSGTKKLLPLLSGMKTRIISGISSLSAFCSRIGISYEDIRNVSLHGRAGNIAINVATNEKCFFLLGGNLNAAAVCRRLTEFGLGSVTVHIGENLGSADEMVRTGTAEELSQVQTAPLSVMITENAEFIRHLPSGITDNLFTRGEVPMTKASVRCCAVGALEIRRDDVCWDIGCGTGSVSVEMAYRCPTGAVFSFDKKHDATLLTAENSRKFHCDNIKVIEGNAPEILADAPAPDRVFIGGSGGNLSEIFRIISGKNPDACIVVTAVTLETLNAAVSAFSEISKECSVSQIAVTDTRKIGGYTMLQAQNPVFIIRGLQ